jgi:hypothetical protein
MTASAPATAPVNVQSLVEKFATLAAREMQKLMVHGSPTPTPSTLAGDFIKMLGENDKQAQVRLSQDPVLTLVQSTELKYMKTEWECVRFMTPHFTTLLGDELVVVNSEECGWLVTGGSSQKPDLFATLKWVYERRKLKEALYLDRYSAGFRFGGIYDTRLYDSVFILDCKLSCTNTALGELIIHLQHVAHKLPSHSVVRGMLFSTTTFMLVKVQGIELIERTTGEWVTAGSKTCISEFFQPLPWSGVEQICRNLDVEVDESPEGNVTESGAFLGAGGFGRVIRVRREKKEEDGTSKNIFALKVSLSKYDTELEVEHGRLQIHAKECSCDLLVRPESLLYTARGLCGYLMSPVGQPFVRRQSLTAEMLKRAVHALYRLHTHNPPIIHGDARLANLIIRSDTDDLTWVDLSHSQWGLEMNVRGLKNDITTFIGSVIGDDCKEGMPHYEEFEACAIACSNSTTEDTYLNILYEKLKHTLNV